MSFGSRPAVPCYGWLDTCCFFTCRHTDVNIRIPTSDSSQVSQPCFSSFHFPYNPIVKKKEGDECNVTAHNIPFPVLCSTLSVILSQLKNCLMLMHSDSEIKHQSASLLVDSVGLHVCFYTDSLLQEL